MKIPPQSAKLLLIPAAAAIGLLGLRLYAAERKPYKFDEHLHIYFPKDYAGVVNNKKKFVDAVNNHSGPAENGKKAHQLSFQGDVIADGVEEKSETHAGSTDGSDKIVGIHVAQRIGFESMAELDAFSEEVAPTPTPTPTATAGKGG